MEGCEVIHHFYSAYEPKDASTRHRQVVAKMTWSTQLWNEIPVYDSDVRRLWKEEGKQMPYVRDVFDFAAKGLPAEDILVYTNSDICVVSNCAQICAAALQGTDAFYSFRRDFNHDFSEPIPDDVVLRGNSYAGSDLYGFRVHWWQTNRNDYPDLIIGIESWDAVLRHLIELTNPGRLVNVPDTHYHRRHDSWWENNANRYRLKAQVYALKTASSWLHSHGFNPQMHGIPLTYGPSIR